MKSLKNAAGCCRLDPNPWILLGHFFAVALYAVYHVFRTQSLWLLHRSAYRSTRIFLSACSIIFPLIWSELKTVVRLQMIVLLLCRNPVLMQLHLCCIPLGSETRISESEVRVLAEFRVSHLEIRHFRLKWNDISYCETRIYQFPSPVECSIRPGCTNDDQA